MRVQARRMYAAHRRAWTPRLWPMLLAAGAATAALDLLLAPGVLAAIGLGLGLGVGGGWARWTIWRHRHPIITPAQYITDLQRKARWN